MLLTNYAIKFRSAVFVVMVVLAIAGLFSYFTIPREEFPDVTIPYVFVTAVYEGTAPEEIENLVTIPIEKKLKELDNVKDVRSSSAEGVAVISIQFTPKQDMDTAIQRVREKVDLARPDLPDDLKEPGINAMNPSTDFPVLILALSGDPDLERLRKVAEDLQDVIELQAGVKEAVVSGAREREIRVEMDLERMAAKQIPVSLLMQKIPGENSTISAGNLDMAGGKFQVRIPGEIALASELKNLILDVRDGKPVYLSDVAAVTDTFKDLTTISRINGQPCVSLNIKKRTGENSIAIIRDVNRVIDAYTLPPGVKITVIRDQSEYIKMMLEELENSIVTGVLLVVLVLLAFMGRRNSLFVGLALPFSLMITFIVLHLMGMTMNMLVLFSLVLVLGMLVDDAIVIVENIFRLRCEGLSRMEAALQGASEVAWPVITSTLTAVAAFAPLIFWPDILGQFMSFLPKTAIIALMASLVVAIVINPALCSVFVRRVTPKEKEQELAGAKGGGRRHWFVAGYVALLRGALRHRGFCMVVGFLFLILSVEMFARFVKGFELFPQTDPRNASVEVKFPEGTSIEKTDAALRRIEGLLAKYGDIKFFLTNVGSAGQSFHGAETGTHVGSINIEFVKASQRKENSARLVELLREDVGLIPGAEVKVDRERMGPPTEAPVSIELSGDDFEALGLLSGEIRRKIRPVPALVDLQDDLVNARPELQVQVDRQRAALMGLNTDAIGQFLRSAVYGIPVSKYRVGDNEYDITIRLPERQRDSPDMLERLYVATRDGRSVPLSSVGRIQFTGGRGAIKRKDYKRVVTITGDIQTQKRSIREVLDDIKPVIGKIPLPPGYGVTYSGENKDMEEASAFLKKAFFAALGLIAVILVVQFNSPLRVLIIVISLMLSMIGAMWGLIICQQRFSVIMTGIGIVCLLGVVAKNGIVLIDCIRQREAMGLSCTEAILLGGRLRLRPVLLTAATAVLGLIPMAAGYSLEIHTWPPSLVAGAESSDWWAPMAVAVIFGLSLATLLTLVQVPVMYSLANSFTEWLKKRFSSSDEE